MKLRKKISLALAAAMLATSMPAMAASTNTISKVPVVGKDALVGFTTTTDDVAGKVVTRVLNGVNAPSLNVKFDDATQLVPGRKEAFIIKLTEGEFEDVREYNGGAQALTTLAGTFNMKLTRNSSTELMVEVGTTVTAAGVIDTSTGNLKSFDVPLYIKAKGAAPSIEIISENSLVTSSKIVIAAAATTDKKADVTIADAEKFYDKGTLAKITILESYPNAFKDETDPLKRIVKVTLEHDDFGYDLISGDLVGKVTRGTNIPLYFGTKAEVDNATVVMALNAAGTLRNVPVVPTAYLDTDKQVLIVKVPGNLLNQTIRYSVELDGLKVSARKPELGTFEVTVGGDLVDEKTVKAAEVVEFGVKVAMKDNKPKVIKAGRNDKVEFTFEEVIEDSMALNRSAEFKLENGHFMHDSIKSIANKGTATEAITYASKISEIDKALTLEIFQRDYIKAISQNDTVDVNKVNAITALIYDGKKVVGFEFTPSTLRNNKKDKFTFKDVKVEIDLGDREKETAKLVVSGSRMFGPDVTTDAVTIVNPVKVEFVGLTAKVGLKNQKFADAKVILTETEKGVLKKDKLLVFDLDENDAIKFAADPVVTVKQGNVKLVNKDDFTISKTDGSISITIKRESKEPATIEITGFELSLDRTVPQGNYDLKIKGAALTDCGDIALKAFVKVGTPNTEDITNNGLRKGVSSFTIGSTKYIVNDIEKDMDAAAYIEGASTMLPIRYVAEALGVKAQDILFAAGKVTIVAGNRTIQLASGSNVAVLNGANVAMAQKAVIKDGRTYVPVGEVARLLGVKVEWDNATKTAKFINE